MDLVIKKDLEEIKKEFATPRRSTVEDGKEAFYIEDAPIIQEVTFVMDRFGYCKVMERSAYDRNRETVDNENLYVINCLSTDKICLFTDIGSLHQIKVTDIPFGKLRDKGIPIDNVSKYDTTKERVLSVVTAQELPGKQFLFASKMAMVKLVPGEEFLTNNRMVAATKLMEEDRLISIQAVNGEEDVVLQSSQGVFLRFPISEISLLKKNSRGVRGMKLGKDEALEQIYFPDHQAVITYKDKEVHLNRLKIGKRDGKGSKVRL